MLFKQPLLPRYVRIGSTFYGSLSVNAHTVNSPLPLKALPAPEVNLTLNRLNIFAIETVADCVLQDYISGMLLPDDRRYAGVPLTFLDRPPVEGLSKLKAYPTDKPHIYRYQPTHLPPKCSRKSSSRPLCGQSTSWDK